MMNFIVVQNTSLTQIKKGLFLISNLMKNNLSPQSNEQIINLHQHLKN